MIQFIKEWQNYIMWVIGGLVVITYKWVTRIDKSIDKLSSDVTAVTNKCNDSSADDEALEKLDALEADLKELQAKLMKMAEDGEKKSRELQDKFQLQYRDDQREIYSALANHSKLLIDKFLELKTQLSDHYYDKDTSKALFKSKEHHDTH